MNLIIILRQLKRIWMQKKYGLKNASKTALIASQCSISKDLHIDDYAYVGPHCTIPNGVYIGKYTMLANDVMIVGGDHNFRNPLMPIIFNGREEKRETHIGVDCWVGAGSIIIAGVSIGDGSIIAAGSVVTKDIPPYSIYGGNTARFIKKRFSIEDEILYKQRMADLSSKRADLEKLLSSGRDFKQ